MPTDKLLYSFFIRRIVCLTDGLDNVSKTSPQQLVTFLKVCDVISHIHSTSDVSECSFLNVYCVFSCSCIFLLSLSVKKE